MRWVRVRVRDEMGSLEVRLGTAEQADWGVP